MLRGQRFVVLLSLACTWALAAPGATDFENLLQKIELTHSKLDDGSYRILVAGDVDATFVNAQVLDLEYKIVFLYCPVLVPPRDVVPPTAFYKKIAELNDEMIVGRLSLTPEGAVFYLNYAQIRRSHRRWSCGDSGTRVNSVISQVVFSAVSLPV